MGRNWIFMRGLTRGQGHWGDFPALFRERFPGDEIEHIDLAGNGERFRERSFVDAAEAARDVRARSKFVSDGRPVRMLALSLGGMVAVEWMRQFPADFEKLYLVNTSCRGLTAMHGRLNPRKIGTFVRLFAAADPFERERLVLSLIARDQERIRSLLPGMAAYSISHPVTIANLVRQLVCAARASFPKSAPGPIEIVCSRGDELVSVENSLRLAERWGIPPRLHASAGHDLPIDDPQWLLDQFGAS